MLATLTDLAARVADEVLGDTVNDVVFADAVDDLLTHVFHDAADTIDTRFGGLADAGVYALLIEAFAAQALRETLATPRAPASMNA